MGFAEGLEDELLLTCFVCKGSFGMLAMFCGECGCKRDQALGIERATTQQRILGNDLNSPSFQNQELQNPSTVDPVAPQNSLTPTKKRSPRKSIPFQIFRQNMRLRLERTSNFQQLHAIKLNMAGSLLLMASIYIAIQGSIFASSNPVLNIEDILKSGITRESDYFEALGADSGSSFFPASYQPWNASGAREWVTTYKVNGWTGSGTIIATPAGDGFDDIPIEIQVKAVYVSKFKIFRDIKWVSTNQPAQLKIKYPSNPSTLIYVNGLSAGSVGSPVIPEDTYWMYPGPLEIKFYEDGSETADSVNYFIDSFGSYEVS
jgi:hypothetical protein